MTPQYSGYFDWTLSRTHSSLISSLPFRICDKVNILRIWQWAEHRYPKWVALVRMKSLRSIYAGGLMLTHTHIQHPLLFFLQLTPLEWDFEFSSLDANCFIFLGGFSKGAPGHAPSGLRFPSLSLDGFFTRAMLRLEVPNGQEEAGRLAAASAAGVNSPPLGQVAPGARFFQGKKTHHASGGSRYPCACGAMKINTWPC